MGIGPVASSFLSWFNDMEGNQTSLDSPGSPR
jgi:hypothetical protein